MRNFQASFRKSTKQVMCNEGEILDITEDTYAAVIDSVNPVPKIITSKCASIIL